MTRLHLPIAVLLFLASFLGYASFIGKSPFASKGEAREALVVKNMLEQHNFILPQRNCTEVPSKPPLFHWLGAGAGTIRGHLDEFSVRIPSAFAAGVSLLVFFLFAAPLAGTTPALLAILILATSFEWSRSASLARVDMLFSALLTLAYVLIYRFVEEWKIARRVSSFTAIALGLAVGAAALTKGPAGLVLPGLCAAAAVICRCGYRIPIVKPLLATAIALVLAASWYGSAYLVGGKEFFTVQLMRENIARLTGAEGYAVGHEKPFFFSIIDLLVGFLPWSLFLPLLVAVLWKRRWSLDWPSRYALIWLAIFIAVVSFAQSKRPVYLLPVFPPLAYLLATVLSTVVPALHRRTLRVASLLLALLTVLVVGLTGLLAVLPLLPSSALSLSAKNAFLLGVVRDLIAQYPLLFGSLGVAAVILFWSGQQLLRGAVTRSAFALAFALLLFIGMTGHVILPYLARRNSPRDFAQAAFAIYPPGATLHQYKRDFYPTLFYFPACIASLQSARELPSASFVLLAKRDVPTLLSERPEAVVRLESGGLAADGDDWVVLAQLP